MAMKGFVDSNLVLSDAQAVVDTASSTNSIKLPNTTVGEGRPLYVHIGIDTAMSVVAGGITFSIRDSADGVTYAATELSSAAVTTSSLVTGNTELYHWPLPADTKQYVQVLYTVTGTPSDGTFDAWVGYH